MVDIISSWLLLSIGELGVRFPEHAQILLVLESALAHSNWVTLRLLDLRIIENTVFNLHVLAVERHQLVSGEYLPSLWLDVCGDQTWQVQLWSVHLFLSLVLRDHILPRPCDVGRLGAQEGHPLRRLSSSTSSVATMTIGIPPIGAMSIMAASLRPNIFLIFSEVHIALHQVDDRGLILPFHIAMGCVDVSLESAADTILILDHAG